MVEQWSPKPRAEGSNPSAPAKNRQVSYEPCRFYLFTIFQKNYGGSNINRFSPYKLCEIEKIDCIISDTDIKAYLKGDYQKLHFIIAN